jgi:esterase/lipase superfamily enzyme
VHYARVCRREIDGSHVVAASQKLDFSHVAADITRASNDARALGGVQAWGASNVIGKVRIRFKINVIENACLIARAIHLMTHSEFAEGYNLIRDMEGSEFLTALRMLARREVMVKKLSEFKERHKAKQSESLAVLLARTAEAGDQEAISLLAAGALETRV